VLADLDPELICDDLVDLVGKAADEPCDSGGARHQQPRERDVRPRVGLRDPSQRAHHGIALRRRQARLASGLGQAKLATLAGASQPMLSAYERGHWEPVIEATLHAPIAPDSEFHRRDEDTRRTPLDVVRHADS